MEEAQARRGRGQAAAARCGARAHDAPGRTVRPPAASADRRAGICRGRPIRRLRDSCRRCPGHPQGQPPRRGREPCDQERRVHTRGAIEPPGQRRASDGGSGRRGRRRSQARARHLRQAHSEGRTHSAREREHRCGAPEGAAHRQERAAFGARQRQQHSARRLGRAAARCDARVLDTRAGAGEFRARRDRRCGDRG